MKVLGGEEGVSWKMFKSCKAQKNVWNLLVSVRSYQMRIPKVLVLIELSKKNYPSLFW